MIRLLAGTVCLVSICFGANGVAAGDSLGDLFGKLVEEVAKDVAKDVLGNDDAENGAGQEGPADAEIVDDNPEDVAQYVEGLDLEPVGPVDKAGCHDIEVIGYAQSEVIAPDMVYYMALRNNGGVERIVTVQVRGGLNVLGRRNSSELTVSVPPGRIEQFRLDYSENPPELVRIERCL